MTGKSPPVQPCVASKRAIPSGLRVLRSRIPSPKTRQKKQTKQTNTRYRETPTNKICLGEAEPRRSVRATKGQHTKSFDEIEPVAMPKRRQTKKAKKAKEQEPEEEQEAELIRCVCGASEQDEDSGEAWIACEDCGAWQHNVCVGVSSFEDEIPEHYWCEECRPQNHKELLDAIARGEKLWEVRRKAHEENKKKKKGGKKGKGKRTSESKEELEKPAASKAKPSPAPDTIKDKKEPALKQGKRKAREDSHDTEGKTSKIRRVSENEAVPVPAPVPAPAPASYTPPDDLAKSLADLPNSRTGPAKALTKSISHALTSMQKQGNLRLDEGSSIDSEAEAFALQIERAVFDTHPATKGQKEYNLQIKTLSFNLKNNPELCNGLVSGAMAPTSLSIMTSEQLASSEMQRQTAELKAKAEKQAILYTADTGPRIRRTHKGEEIVEEEPFNNNEAPPPLQTAPRRQASQSIKNEPTGGDKVDLASHPTQTPDGLGAQRSPSNPNFDITKVFSTVGTQVRRPSAPVGLAIGPGVDPDVDRMLQDENDSPPYSPTEETQDPDVVWRGSLAMSSIADFQATAKHIGGADFAGAKIGPWSQLIPKRMTVAGRIPQQSAIEYLCSLRYSNLTDIIVVNITPASPASQAEFNALIDYFVSKKRYGVVGDKVAGNVRDTYLVPVPPGEDNHPEFMLNLLDNKIPRNRAEPMLLAVFVYRNDPEQLKERRDPSVAGPVQTPQGTPTPSAYGQRSNSTSGPGFSPATPQQPFPPQQFNGHLQSTTPVPIPQPPHTRPPPPTPAAAPQPSGQMSEAEKYHAQQAGQAMAREVLGPLISVPTVQFILPQAFQMSRKEWEVIRGIFDVDQRAREDLTHLGVLLEKRSAESKAEGQA
ncbi:Fc.00g113870.m01.CDS01 [Cosmosporella sp. VM-42]